MAIEITDLPPKMRAQAEAKIAAQTKKKSENDKLVDEANKIRESEKETANKRNKYGNVPTEYNGIRFDSKKECERYVYLKAREDAGEIEELKLQVHFTLSEAFTWSNGEKAPRLEYIADFTYIENGEKVIEDVKSAGTKSNPVYRAKKAMMAARGKFIREV